MIFQAGVTVGFVRGNTEAASRIPEPESPVSPPPVPSRDHRGKPQPTARRPPLGSFDENYLSVIGDGNPEDAPDGITPSGDYGENYFSLEGIPVEPSSEEAEAQESYDYVTPDEKMGFSVKGPGRNLPPPPVPAREKLAVPTDGTHSTRNSDRSSTSSGQYWKQLWGGGGVKRFVGF